MSRSFRVIQPACDSIFHGNTPVAAAKKVCSRECKNNSCVVIVQDTKTGKEYKYKVSRVYDPVTIQRNGVEVTYDYKVTAKSLNINSSDSRSASRSKTSRSKKKCSVGKVWRRAYRSPSGKRVPGKCVRKGGPKRNNRSRSRSRK